MQLLPTSTCAAFVKTDAGDAYLKGMGNPAGDIALASELVAGELARLIGLSTPDFAVVDLDLDIRTAKGGVLSRGPAFASRRVPGDVFDGTDRLLHKLRRPADIAKLVVFDTWVRNHDRCPPIDSRDPAPNWDNLILSPHGRYYDLVAIDHSHCFVEGDLEASIGDRGLVDDDRIFGLFPEFELFIREADVLDAVAQLARVGAGFVREIVNSTPPQWGPSSVARGDWIDFIVERARLVASFAPDRLLRQGRLEV